MTHHELLEYTAWLLSILSGTVIYVMGLRKWWAPLLGVLTQIVWIFYVINSSQIGLFLGVSLYMIVHLVNAKKWYRLHKEGKLIVK